MHRNSGAVSSAVHDELDSFQAISREASKVDRCLLQQSENLQRLVKTRDRYAAKLEKLKTQSTHLDDQLKFALITNKSIKENLKGKRQSKQTMEALVSNLERQLFLEELDIKNKIKGFQQTQEKYDSMWKKYEDVYKKMPHMAKKEEAVQELDEMKLKTDTINKEIELIKKEADAIEKDTDQKWCEVALLLAEHVRNQKLEEKCNVLIAQRDELRDQVQMLQIELEKAEIMSKRSDSQEKNKIGKLRSMISTLDLKGKQKFQACLDDSGDEQSQEESEYEASDVEGHDFESLFEIENDFETANLKTSSPRVSRKLTRQTPVKRKASSPLMPGSPVVAIPQVQPREPEPAILVTVVEMDVSQVVKNAEKEIENSPEIEISEPAVDVAPCQPDQLESIAEEPVPVVAVTEEIQTHSQPAALEEENFSSLVENFSSQMTEVPIDLQQEQQQVLGETVPNLIPPAEAKDIDACSQGTESTACSSLVNLLDDDKRKEYMRRLMASPTLTVHDDEPAAPKSLAASSTVTDNGYLQNFFLRLNQGGTDQSARAAASTLKSSNADAQSTASFLLEPNPQKGDDIAFPGFSRQTDFASGFDAESMFGAAAPSGEAAGGFFTFGGNPSAPPQQQTSGFSFNFGDKPQNSSFMNLF